MIAGLPYDAEVEYLESTGTQWIDTGRPIPADFWFDATIDITGTNNAYKTLLGARISSGNQDYQFSFQSANNSFLARYGTNSKQYFGTQQTGMMRIRVESGGKLYINESFVHQLGVGSPSDILNMYIFALNNNGAASQQAKYIRLYSIRYGGTNEAHDIIPVRFTNELGQSEGAMYDRVSRKLFRNQGTGSFVTGQDVAVPVMGLHFMRRPRYMAKDYVQDGLVAMWDGEWNAGWGLHDSNATTWKDLVGTRDATLSGTYSWGAKSWARDASSSTKCLLPDIPLGQNFMCEYCCALHNAGDGNFRDFSTTSSTRFELVQNSNNNTVSFYRNVNDSYVSRFIGTLGTSRVARTFSFGFDTLGGIYALDGGSVLYDRTVNTPISTSFYNNPTFSVGQYSTLSEDADYYNIRIYSRPLTADEIAHNYAVDKERFNLP